MINFFLLIVITPVSFVFSRNQINRYNLFAFIETKKVNEGRRSMMIYPVIGNQNGYLTGNMIVLIDFISTKNNTRIYESNKQCDCRDNYAHQSNYVL